MFRPWGLIVLPFWIKKASLAFRMESRLKKICSIGINCMSLAVWLGEDKKCFAAVVRPASQNPYPIYDLTKNSKPYLWPEPYIKILFQTCIIIGSQVQTNVNYEITVNIICEGLLLIFFSIIPILRLEYKNHTLIYDQNGQNQLKWIPYLWPKRLKNHTLWGRTYPYSPYKGVPPPGFRFGVRVSYGAAVFIESIF